MTAIVSRLLLFQLSSSSSSPASLLRASQRYHYSSFPSLFSSTAASSFPPNRLALFFTSILRPYSTGRAALFDPDLGPLPPPAVSLSHPWPEWQQFLDKLRMKGYFELSTSSSRPTEEGGADGDGGGEGAIGLGESHDLTLDVNRLKNACLKFARERFDIFRSLPKEDIVAIVECGCPSLFTKPVNSAKRLRSYLQLDEGDVCGTCYSRGSCDKAYIIPTEEGARTVDIVRIFLSYAINPENISGRANSSFNQNFHDSARKLLSELIKLSDTTTDPSLPKPAIASSTKKVQSPRFNVKDKSSPNVEMKRGDWLCPSCNFLNFSRNLRCMECKEDGPKRVNFDQAEKKLGDWNCPKCEFLNFARNKMCFRCEGPRPKLELNPGEWECPSHVGQDVKGGKGGEVVRCNYVNFSRNTVCKRCDFDRPEDAATGNHSWKRQGHSRKSNNVNLGFDEDELDQDEDILPQQGENKFVVTKRATTAERRFTAARKRSY